MLTPYYRKGAGLQNMKMEIFIKFSEGGRFNGDAKFNITQGYTFN